MNICIICGNEIDPNMCETCRTDQIKDHEQLMMKRDFQKMQERDKERFGFENTLLQSLWDGQVEEEYLNDTIHNIMAIITLTHTDKEWKAQFEKTRENLDENFPIEE